MANTVSHISKVLLCYPKNKKNFVHLLENSHFILIYYSVI